MSEHQTDAVADRVVELTKAHVAMLVQKGIAAAERGFLGQIEILRQHVADLERDIAELKAKQ